MNYMCILTYVCFLPLVMAILPKCDSMVMVTLSTTEDLTCDILRSSTYQVSVHYLPSIILFAIHKLYGYRTKLYPLNVSENSLYQSSPKLMHPYSSFTILWYITFLPYYILHVFHIFWVSLDHIPAPCIGTYRVPLRFDQCNFRFKRTCRNLLEHLEKCLEPLQKTPQKYLP